MAKYDDSTLAYSSIRMITPVLSLLAEIDHPVEQILKDAGISFEKLSDDSERLKCAQIVDVWQKAQLVLQDDLIGLRAAKKYSKHWPDAIWHVFRTSENLLGGFKRVFQSPRLVYDSSLVGVDVQENVVILYYARHPTLKVPSYIAEFLISSWIAFSKEVLRIDLEPIQVRFSHPRPRHTSDLESHFQCSLVFDAERTEVHFRLENMLEPLPHSDPFLASILDQHVQNLMATLPPVDGIAEEIRIAITRNLKCPEMSAKFIAAKLKMSERSLYRRLNDENQSFQEILDSVRYSSARLFLSDSSLPISEVSYLLGFSELSSFYRAFRKWSGETPLQFRLKQAKKSD